MPGKPAVLIEAEKLDTRIRELGAQITRDYASGNLILVGVLKGAFVVLADLARLIDLPARIDFIAVSSYGSETKSSGVVSIIKDLDLDIRGQHVLIVEDIVDSGLTLDYLVRSLKTREPASVEIFTLLSKPGARKIDIDVKYCGFEVPDTFVVGFGLDCAERFRELPYVGVLEEETTGA